MGPRQPVSVAGIEFDALMESSEDYSASVPQYPVDAGYSVQDHVALEPLTLKMTLFVTATPVTWLSRHGSGENRIHQICERLLEIYRSRSIIEVVTQDQSYDNLVIKGITIKKTQSLGYAREIPIEFSQVTVTSAMAAAVPAEYERSGTSKQSAGNASTTKLPDKTSTSASDRQSGAGDSESTAEKGNTILYDIVDGVGDKTGWFSFD